MSVEVWLSSPSGARITHLDLVQELEYAQALNNVGAIVVVLPADYDDLLSLDKIIELWIDGRFITVGFIRKVKYFDDEDGGERTLITGYTPNYLLTSRIIAYAAGTAQADMSDYADDMLKEIVTDNLGGDATGDRDISGLNFSVDDQLGDAPRITKGFAWRKLFDVCLDICAASEENGTRLYFEVMPYWYASEAIGFKFITYINQPGADFGTDSGQPLYFGRAWGNLVKPELEYDHSEEITHVYAGGQGEGSDRLIEEVSDTDRAEASIWNYREGFADARNEKESAGIESKAYKVLNENAPLITLSGEIVETGSRRWGLDWNLGDKVVVEHRGISTDAIINSLRFKLLPDGSRSLTCGFKVVGALPGLGFTLL
jgi:hypothetical protein